ncbi:MAG: hypothetical protein V1905_01255 [bacterium]
MPRIRKILIAITLAGILIPVVSVFAADTYRIRRDPTGAEYTTICYEGMIPCGKNMYCGGAVNGDKCTGSVAGKGNTGCKPVFGTGTECVGAIKCLVTIDCQLCHFFILGKGILSFVVKIVLSVSALLIVVGGFMYLVCSGNPSCISRANSIFKSVAIGIVIMFAAWVIVGTIFVQLGVQSWTGLVSWHRITCPIVSDCCN